jgi:membrane-bound lytic murein transglycosylase A
MDGRPDLRVPPEGSVAALPGWRADDMAGALDTFRRMADHPLSDQARAATDPHAFFERHFSAGAARPAHVTGYYEPELDASLTRTDAFRVPLHARPDGGCTLPRDRIDTRLTGQEIAYLRDEVARFFLQVQGSGRLRLPDGSVQRLRYAGGNGQPYRSIGRLLIERGVFGPELTADMLQDWLRADPVRGRAVMAENPSYVFFRFHDGPAGDGPIGTMGVPLTAMRSLAADRAHIPLGTPVWLEAEGVRRLWIAQDTGGAIVGPGRLDLFHGTGEAAGRAAGRLNAAGRAVPLTPR